MKSRNSQLINEMRCHAFLNAVQQNEIQKIVSYIRMGVSLNYQNKDNESAVFICCKNGYLDILIILFNNKVDLNKLGQNGETPIFQACKHNHYNIFSFLLSHESNPLIHNNNNETCLDWACLNNNKDIIFSLLNYYNQKDYKIPIDQINKVLVWSVQEDQIEITKVLLPKGNVNCNDNSGESLISIACKNGSDLMMKLLIHNGATAPCFKEIDDTVNETVNETNEEIILPPMFPEETLHCVVPSETCMDQVIECLETLIEEVVDEIEDPSPEPDSKKKKRKGRKKN